MGERCVDLLVLSVRACFCVSVWCVDVCVSFVEGVERGPLPVPPSLYADGSEYMGMGLSHMPTPPEGMVLRERRVTRPELLEWERGVLTC